MNSNIQKMHIDISYHEGNERARIACSALKAEAERQGFTVSVFSDSDIHIDSDAAFLAVLGGDGTIIRYATKASLCNIPILGIHMGRIGFLSEISPEGFGDALRAFLNGNYTIEKHMMLSVRVNGSEPRLCINDVIVSKPNFSGTAEIELTLDGKKAAHAFCDSVIFATPTGATAYSLSAGGSVIAPGLDAIAITPVCSHTLSFKPIVASPAADVRIRVLGPGKVAADGDEFAEINRNDIVTVANSNDRAGFIRFSERNLFALIKEKLV